MAKKKTANTVDILELDYQLAELPSSQHRAGLAGLVLMVSWLKRQGEHKGNCEIIRLDERGATLRIDELGLDALFNEVYAASLEEKEEDKLRMKKNGEVIPPIRTSVREEVVKGKAKSKTLYVYPVVIPKGAFLTDYDPSGDDGVWVKLWRRMLFQIFRGRDRQRIPFKSRAHGEPTDDTAKTWEALCQPFNYPVKLPSTFFLGSQEHNAESVPFQDRARYQLLLHFWIYVAQVYVPALIDNEGKSKFTGYAITIPDVSELKTFCEELPKALHERSTKVAAKLPQDAIVDLAIEGALDTIHMLRERLSVREGERRTFDLVLSVDVVHADKPGDNIEILGTARVDPELRMDDEYVKIRRAFWNPLFRKQRILNLIKGRPWYTGFDSLLSRLPYEELFAEREIGFKYFRRDARECFKHEVREISEEANSHMIEAETAADVNQKDSGASQASSCEALIYRLVGNYITRKLKSKYQQEWAGVKDNPAKRDEYEKNKEKIARDAFLAVRSRTGADFADYFASTLCSVPQFMTERDFQVLAQALHEDSDKVRTLTMLALSARA